MLVCLLVSLSESSLATQTLGMSGKARAQKSRDKKGRVAKKSVPTEQPRKISTILDRPRLAQEGARPEDGVQDMTILSDLDETGININLRTRYQNDLIYVSYLFVFVCLFVYFYALSLDLHWDYTSCCQSIQTSWHIRAGIITFSHLCNMPYIITFLRK